MSEARKARRARERLQRKAEVKVGRRALPLYPDTPTRKPIRLKYASDLASGVSRQRLLETARTEADSLAAMIFGRAGMQPACKAGCSYCCHVHVTVGADEVRALAAVLRRLPPDALETVRGRVAENASKARGHSSTTYRFTPCALLTEDGRCSVYADRPFACRRAHSFDADICRRGIEGGENVGAPSLAFALMAHGEVSGAHTEAVAAFGGDARSFELHQALEILLLDPNGDLTPALDLSDQTEMQRDLRALNPGSPFDESE
jgi:Putative zinc- or iron-chelating domain